MHRHRCDDPGCYLCHPLSALQVEHAEHVAHPKHRHRFRPGPHGCSHPEFDSLTYCGCPKECHLSLSGAESTEEEHDAS